MLSRIIAIAVALVACAWFALGLRQSTELNRATALLSGSGSLSRGQANRIRGLLDAAGTLNPDRQVEIMRGVLAEGQNQTRQALAIFERIVQAEPMNLSAWAYLTQAGLNNASVVRRAVAHIAELDPAQKSAR